MKNNGFVDENEKKLNGANGYTAVCYLLLCAIYCIALSTKAPQYACKDCVQTKRKANSNQRRI
jgi:hypothetical protein